MIQLRRRTLFCFASFFLFPQFLKAQFESSDIPVQTHDTHWIYRGSLPALENPKIFVSLKGHTLRITGNVSAHALLPHYAISEFDSTKNQTQKIHIVYPIATANIYARKPNGTPYSNGPGMYSDVGIIPYLSASEVNGEKVPWGGFPYIEYNHLRGLAFHGPITSKPLFSVNDSLKAMASANWNLLRGPVSHGCNRMQGEHVVELAHLLGAAMNKPHFDGESLRKELQVNVAENFDSLRGHPIDVNYAATANVTLPSPGSSTQKGKLLFPTWNAAASSHLVCPKNYRSSANAVCPQPQKQFESEQFGLGKLLQPVCEDNFELKANVESASNPKWGYCLSTDGQNIVKMGKTKAMVASCLNFGMGNVCQEPLWPLEIYNKFRGESVCPVGSEFNGLAQRCVEKGRVVGPFSRAFLNKCDSRTENNSSQCPSLANEFDSFKLHSEAGIDLFLFSSLLN
jgi:hypothetical protein